MRLNKELIRHLSETIAANLLAKQVATATEGRTSLAAKIEEIITADIQAEDRLNKEVEQLLSSHEAEISKSGMDYRKVFELTKQKLAKERGIVL